VELIKSDMPNWVELGKPLCREIDPELFFPIRFEDVIQTRQAKAICRGCELLKPCLEYALDRPEIVGIWGGTSWTDRTKMRSMRRAS
jgi:WhiB family transcriptional regulator, redox-sensing transcriptional regulator